MLILTRRIGESLHIGDDVRVTVTAVRLSEAKVKRHLPFALTPGWRFC